MKLASISPHIKNVTTLPCEVQKRHFQQWVLIFVIHSCNWASSQRAANCTHILHPHHWDTIAQARTGLLLKTNSCCSPTDGRWLVNPKDVHNKSGHCTLLFHPHQSCLLMLKLFMESTGHCSRSMQSRVCETVLCPYVCPSLRPSVCLSQHEPTAVNLLLQIWCCGHWLHLPAAGECGQCHICQRTQVAKRRLVSRCAKVHNKIGMICLFSVRTWIMQVKEREDISSVRRSVIFWTLTCIVVRRPHILGESWWTTAGLVTATTLNAFPVCRQLFRPLFLIK